MLKFHYETDPPGASPAPEDSFERYKFYQDAAENAKAHAWTQSTWVLTLNGAILAFSINLHVKHCNIPGFFLIEWFSAGAGVLLSLCVVFVLYELGKHIKRHWAASDRIASKDPQLAPYVSKGGAKEKVPKFIKRLMFPAGVFAVGHVAWAVSVTWFIACGITPSP